MQKFIHTELTQSYNNNNRFLYCETSQSFAVLQITAPTTTFINKRISRIMNNTLWGNVIATASLAITAALASNPAQAYQGMPTPKLHVTGRFLQDPNGKNVTLHGYMQPGASWFNGEGHNYANPTDFTSVSNVAPALAHYNAVADIMTTTGPLYGQKHGWYCSFVRFIGDGSSPENFAPGWDAEGKLAKPDQFDGWLKNVVVPYVTHCRSRGLYVVLCGNPSESFPDKDKGHNMSEQYQQNLIAFWKTVASYPGIKNADNVMFEICNEPIAIESRFGANDWKFGNDTSWAAITRFMQPVVDAIRGTGSENVVWVPGLGWQGEYAGFAKYPVTGKNIGYAAHDYPAYGGAHDDPAQEAHVWSSNYKPCADIAPMIITEMMWKPNEGKGYEGLWNAHTSGFGNAVKSSIDTQGNVSYLIGMAGDVLENLNGGLATATLGSSEGVQAAFGWWPTYQQSAPTAPAAHAKKQAAKTQPKPRNGSARRK